MALRTVNHTFLFAGFTQHLSSKGFGLVALAIARLNNFSSPLFFLPGKKMDLRNFNK